MESDGFVLLFILSFIILFFILFIIEISSFRDSYFFSNSRPDPNSSSLSKKEIIENISRDIVDMNNSTGWHIDFLVSLLISLLIIYILNIREKIFLYMFLFGLILFSIEKVAKGFVFHHKQFENDIEIIRLRSNLVD